MSSMKTESEKVGTESNKQMIHGMCAQDGSLVSPIDLVLDVVRPLQLEPLQWLNFDVPPFRMKLTNSGDTLVVSAKWAKERPYLTGGPLEGNYVFSQVHFHWGSSEHEGSEHTVRGICYPMEMHVVFFKTRYLTQAAALKQDDGVIILAYLFKLQSHSALGLHWLASLLENVVEPRTSMQVPPMPLATIMVPFDTDYITYWGALVSQNCRHPVMWLVSRSALAISSDDLNLFRSLMNSKKDLMTKNFRATSPAAGRAIFHINPSSDTKNLLLPGAVDPPCQAVIVNYTHTPSVHKTEAKKIFSKGDSNELEAKDKKSKEQMVKDKTRFIDEGTPRNIFTENGGVKSNTHDLGLTGLSAQSIERCPSPQSDKKAKIGTKLLRQCTETKKRPSKEKQSKLNNTELQEQKGDCVHINASTSYITPAGKAKKGGKVSTDPSNGSVVENAKGNKTNNEKQFSKSRLPVPKIKSRRGLESCYASYFKRPDSAPGEPTNGKTPNIKPAIPLIKPKPQTPASDSGMKRKATTTIPRPKTRQGGK